MPEGKMTLSGYRSMLGGKIHGATVTDANVAYEGSVTVDSDLLDLSGIAQYEMVHVLSITTGQRLTTYAINGEPGSGVCCVNGAAAHLIGTGEKVIILTYRQLEESAVLGHVPAVVKVDAFNHPVAAGSAAKAAVAS